MNSVMLSLGLGHFFGINIAWPYKDLKGWDFQQIVELAQIVACRAVKWEVPSGGNILLLDFFLFSRDSVEFTEFISI